MIEQSERNGADFPELLNPNNETIAAMQELERGYGQHFESIAALMAVLVDGHESR